MSWADFEQHDTHPRYANNQTDCVRGAISMYGTSRRCWYYDYVRSWLESPKVRLLFKVLRQNRQPANKQDRRGHETRQSKQANEHATYIFQVIFSSPVNNLASPTRRARGALGRHHKHNCTKETTALVEKVQAA